MTKKQPSTLNPARLGLTDPETDVFRLIKDRQASGLTITTKDISEAWGRDRSHVYRVFEALMNKNLIEKYNTKYYRIKEGTIQK